ncbi:MAG: linear amide C-N hydrolase [Cyanobacterium sp.]
MIFSFFDDFINYCNFGKAIALSVIITNLIQIPVLGCTRAVYIGKEDLVITGRSMDWRSEMDSNLWAFPRGIERSGLAGANSMTWTSKYGSVGVSVWDIGIADGMNEAGLVANMLYLTETEFPTPAPGDTRKGMSLSLWVQYVLDNFATVEQAVEALAKDEFYIIPMQSPDGKEGTVHLSISDATGDSAIVEYIEGKLQIHHSRDYQVMTNSPPFEQQLALNAYWQNIGGTTMLPGTNRPSDRFVRASFYINAIPKTADPVEGAASVFSVMRNASVPLGISTPERPEISSTIWRTVSDQKNRRYFFESTRQPNVFWVDMDKLDLSEGSPVKKLNIVDGRTFSGDTSSFFQAAEPMQFLPAMN